MADFARPARSDINFRRSEAASVGDLNRSKRRAHFAYWHKADVTVIVTDVRSRASKADCATGRADFRVRPISDR